MNRQELIEKIVDAQNKYVSETERTIKWASISVYLMAIVMFIVAIVFFSTHSTDNSVPQNCGIVRNYSDTITEHTNWFFFSEKAFIPFYMTTTKYHSYTMCLDGTTIDRGYLP
jgi:hypothetical protein